MTLQAKHLFLFLIILCSCQTGKLKVICDIPSSIKEASAVEIVGDSNLFWTIEDSGNKNMLYGINSSGKIIKDLTIDNSKNDDWEDLTSDSLDNIYIGDFGNNNHERENFTIYKIFSPETTTANETKAEAIIFSLPEDTKSKDFEAFFLWKNHFYIFSKENKETVVFKVPNIIGSHVAKLVCEIKLKGKNSEVTAVDFNAKKLEIVLLNHDRVIKINDFNHDDFSTGDITYLDFEHDSQKEGICYKDDNTVIITDEFDDNEGGNIYEFKLE